jgi:uncharacterized protein YndB with AHSA1/START domain
MTNTDRTSIRITTTVNAPVEKVWECWTVPIHIMHWNHASDDWQTSWAENDLRAGGKFSYRMESRDGTIGFDFSGKYVTVESGRKIEIALDDDRKVQVSFAADKNGTRVIEEFETEQINPPEMQQKGWQAILNNFKKYVETSGVLEILHFEIVIDKSPEKVYRTMLDEKGYAGWTYEFNASSRFEGTWGKGSKMRFLGQDADGKTGGMVSRIKENIAGRFVSIEHLAIIKDDLEVKNGHEVKMWEGALENYTFRGENGHTVLSVDVNTNEEFKSYFNDTWPKALKRLKAMCEIQ